MKNQFLKCDFCGAVKKEVVFAIGALPCGAADWCMIEGTGKMACPDCYPKASLEGQIAIEKAVKEHNNLP